MAASCQQTGSSKRIGILGYGSLGQYLANFILEHPESGMEIAFIWNRSKDVLEKQVDPSLILYNLEDFALRKPDLVVEVAHPTISKQYGKLILKHCDYMIGSPSALADNQLEKELREAAMEHGLYVPSGAMWGTEDINKMADRNTLKDLRITMKKHPLSLKLLGELKQKNDAVTDHEIILYDGPVRTLCHFAPVNVNTMAAAAIAGHNLGFDGVRGCLVSDPNLTDYHIIEIEVTGPTVDGKTFTVHTVRKNPSYVGEVTGKGTYMSFCSSMARAGGRGGGVHLC